MKHLKKFYAGMLALSAFVLASCGSTAHIEKDTSADFKKYQTYSWIDQESKGKLKNEIAEQNLKTVVNEELQKNGFKEVKGNPDLLLSYDLLVEKSIKERSEAVYTEPTTRVFYNPYTRRYGTIYYPSQFLGYDRFSASVKEGTVSVSMVDAKTDKTIWQGWTTDELNGNKFSSKEVQKNVKSIFKKFEVSSN